ncbi:MAG: divalent-cation tolerance protein CutA [Candidatus Woesearchaeota archaeon]|jgi:periplasmic divalent cation tolerance protein
MSFILLYVTFPDEKSSEDLILHLLNKKLIRCANTFPIKSQYSWKGKIKNEEEVVSILKLKKDNWKKTEIEINKHHPYEIPCITKLDVEANKEYEKWIQN